MIIESGKTAELIDGRVLKARIELGAACEGSVLAAVDGVVVLESREGRYFTVQIKGEMDGLLKALAGHHVRSFETQRATLEDVFMTYYEKEVSA
jgi:hypothetical protein